MLDNPTKFIPWIDVTVRPKVYKTYKESFKQEVLKACESMSNRRVAEQYGINESNVRTWKKRAIEIKDGKALVRKESSGL